MIDKKKNFCLTLRGFNYNKYWKVYDKFYLSKNKLMKKLCRFYLLRVEGRNNCYIGKSIIRNIESPLILPHGLDGIHIAGSAKIGKNVVVLQNVTIGISKGNAPTIGDNCIIGANAVVLGGITIGDNCRIGAGCVVVKNVESNCVVVSQPARIIQKETIDNLNYENWYNL